MKGVELPVNTLIIIVLVIVVLIALISIFYATYRPSQESMNMEAAEKLACQTYTGSSCSQDLSMITISNFDANNNGKLNDGTGISGYEPWSKSANCGSGATSGDNLATLCLCQYDKDSADACAKFCGCARGLSSESGPSPPAPP